MPAFTYEVLAYIVGGGEEAVAVGLGRAEELCCPQIPVVDANKTTWCGGVVAQRYKAKNDPGLGGEELCVERSPCFAIEYAGTCQTLSPLIITKRLLREPSLA